MKRYKCHKIVEAGEIAYVTEFGRERVVLLTDGERVPIGAADDDRIANMMMADHANGLGYLVRDEDGDLSWSPKAAFEAGYTPIE